MPSSPVATLDTSLFRGGMSACIPALVQLEELRLPGWHNFYGIGIYSEIWGLIMVSRLEGHGMTRASGFRRVSEARVYYWQGDFRDCALSYLDL